MRFIIGAISIMLFLIPKPGVSQEKDFTLEDFYWEVGNNHPIAQQAKLLLERGKLTIQEARGSFDPKIVANYNSKNFGGKDYYNLWQSYLQLPTLFNVDFKAGFESSGGQFLNPENSLPNDGLYYAGLIVPIGQGLIHNPRTISLQKSKFENQSLQNQSGIVLNNLLLHSTYAYWNWFENYQKTQVVRNNLGLVIDRFNWVREAVIAGENAAIDSIETLIQVQQWQNKLREAQMSLENSILLLKNYIWSDSLNMSNYTPLLTDLNFKIDIDPVLNQLSANHPELIKLALKSEMLDLDRKLYAEQLKPVLNLNYNLLRSRDGGESLIPFTNDYKMGLQFAFPLLVRKERAKLQLSKLRILENELQITNKTRSTFNKVQQAQNKVQTLTEMIRQQQEVVDNYNVLLEGERTKFENGESSVFLLNSRENKKLENEIKLIKLMSKYGNAIGELRWSAGILFHQLN